MSKYRNINRHPKNYLKGYRMYLMGFSDEEIAIAGLTASEIGKIKKFHTDMIARKAFFSSGQALGIEQNYAKRMLQMFEQKQAGKSLTCNSRTEYPRLKFCFTLLLEGVSDIELQEKFTPIVVNKAKEFINYANANMLTSTISIETGIHRSTVKNLLKMYKTNRL